MVRIERSAVPQILDAGPRFRRRALMVMHFMASKGLPTPSGTLTRESFIRIASDSLGIDATADLGANTTLDYAYNEAISILHDALPKEFRHLKNLPDCALKMQRPEPSPSVRFLESDEWRRVRYQALKRSKGCCECCGSRGTRGHPLHVDHIKPRSKFPELALVLSNLQVLCEDCNIGKGAWDETDWR